MSTTDLNTNNSAQTLFRFATMRNPELSDPKNIKRRFIFRDYTTQKGKFDPKVEAGESLQKILQNPSSINGFTIRTEEDLKTDYAPFYEYAVWVARNKATATKEEFDKKIKACKTANGIPTVDYKIWDNLVYQVVTQKEFYAKELIMQILHLHHILSVYDFTEEAYQDVVKAKVVLPKELFKVQGSSGSSSGSSSTSKNVMYDEKSMKVAEAGLLLDQNQNLSAALKKLQDNYKKQYDSAYNTSFASYQARVKPLQKQLQKEVSVADNKKQILENRINYLTQLSVADPEKFYANSELDMELHRIKDEILNIPSSEVEIPEFSFSFDPEINTSALERSLENEEKNALYKIFGASSLSSALSGITSYDEINQAIAQNNQSLQNTILNNTVLNQETFATVGGVVVPIADSTSGDIPFSVKTFARNASELSILVAVNNYSHSILSGTYKALINGNEITSSSVSKSAGGANILFDINPRILGSQTVSVELFNVQGNVALSDGKQYRFNVTLNVDPASIDPLIKQPVFRGSSVFTLKSTTEATTNTCLPVALRTRSFRSYNDKWLLSMTPLDTTDLFSFVTATFKVLDNNGNTVQSSTELKVIDGGDYLSLFTDGVVPKLQITDAIKAGLQFEGEFTLSNGKVYTCKIPMTPNTAAGLDDFTKTYNLSGDGRLCLKQSNNNNDSNPITVTDGDVFIPSGFGMKNIGITDYKRVEQSTYCYVEGEVAHIENIMAREYKERSTRRLKRSESQTTKSSESEKEKLTDTTSTERHEMQSEVAKILQESKDFAANAGFNASWGAMDNKFGLSANASYATHNSKEESNRQAVTEAKDITARALDRIVTKVKEERIDKILEEFEENNKHGFDNTKGSSHVVGVYRWVDKVVKNQIYNYGKRMMFEFMIPEPAKIHRLGMEVVNTTENKLVKPVNPREASIHKMENFADLNNEITLRYWLGYYNVEADEKPLDSFSIGKSLNGQTGKDISEIEYFTMKDEIQVPDGYIAVSGLVSYSAVSDGDGSSVNLLLGDQHYHYHGFHAQANVGDRKFFSTPYSKLVPISAAGYNEFAGTVNFTVDIQLTLEAKNTWLQKTFNKIIEAYETELGKYNQALAEAKALGVQIKGSNPGFYRKIENTILRRNCISYMLNQNPNADLTFGKGKYYNNGYSSGDETFLNTDIKLDGKFDQYAAFIKFMEQAFEWDIMSYHLYPYYWGDRKSWAELYQFDDNDPIFRAFMQSGMARVIVTVRPGFEEAVRHFMATGQIWNGGEVPVIDDPLFLSLVDEMRSPKATKEGEPWREKIPTSLTILQADSIGLRVEKALPGNCEPGVKFDDNLGEMCVSNFELNNNQIGHSGDKWIEITFNEMDHLNYKNIGDVVFPRKYRCMDNDIVIERDASWNSLDSITKAYKYLAEEVSQIEAVEAFATGENGLTFRINASKLKNFAFTKPGGDDGHDTFKFSVDLTNSVLKISSPEYNKYGYERILDKNLQTISQTEYLSTIPLSRFLI
ncbi:hypothetical protein [uncultured Chryseobacterium sp.]|uniref:hypothetical protein n=2 Tax=uncultured Chryseobacterium sp. TaxID=259322 RepID=UPI0025E8CC6A|nr:hypothetical protein [uncultured Chryseobacterium sp.]